MVLLIGGVKVETVPHDSRALYHMAPHLKDTGVQFVSNIPKQIGPMGLLYISQREFAVCGPHDSTSLVCFPLINQWYLCVLYDDLCLQYVMWACLVFS